MKKVSDFRRKMECMMCRYIGICISGVPDPEEYEDGTCKTKDQLKNRKLEKPESEE